MTRNELEKSLLRLKWYYRIKDGNDEWFADTNLYYNIKIKKVINKEDILKSEYYVYKTMQYLDDYLVSPIECDSLEEAKQLAWKVYVDTIETFFKV
jgi:hypothetical protein